MKMFYIAIVMSMILASCGTTKVVEKPVEVVKYTTIQVEKPRPIVPKPDQVKMRPVVWKVQVIDNKPWYSLDTNNYKNLTLNLNDLRAYISQVNKLRSQ